MMRIKDVWKFEKPGLVLGFVAGIVAGAVGFAALVAWSGITVLP